MPRLFAVSIQGRAGMSFRIKAGATRRERTMEMLSHEEEDRIMALVGRLTVTQDILRNAIVELEQIKVQYERAVGQPKTVAIDTVDPLSARIDTALATVRAVVK